MKIAVTPLVLTPFVLFRARGTSLLRGGQRFRGDGSFIYHYFKDTECIFNAFSVLFPWVCLLCFQTVRRMAPLPIPEGILSGSTACQTLPQKGGLPSETRSNTFRGTKGTHLLPSKGIAAVCRTFPRTGGLPSETRSKTTAAASEPSVVAVYFAYSLLIACACCMQLLRVVLV